MTKCNSLLKCQGDLRGLGDKSSLYLDCANVNILVVILCHSVAGGYHWRGMGKGYTRSLCIISYNCM